MSNQGWWRKLTSRNQPTSGKTPPASSDWLSICTKMAQWFEEERQRFFSTAIKRMESARTEEDPIAIPIVHRTLGGEADLALKAFQLFIASGELAQHVYIPPSNGRAFADLLYAQVCGRAIHDVLRYVRSYNEAANDTTTMFLRLSGDVARYITKNNTQAVIYCYGLLADPIVVLQLMTQIAIALAFDDHEGANCLIAKGNRFLGRILGEEGSSWQK